MSGYGYVKNSTGEVIFSGQFRNGVREGYGIEKYQNDEEYEGIWEEGKKSRKGIYRWGKTGKVEEQTWKNGKRVIEGQDIINE